MHRGGVGGERGERDLRVFKRRLTRRNARFELRQVPRNMRPDDNGLPLAAAAAAATSTTVQHAAVQPLKVGAQRGVRPQPWRQLLH